MQASNGIYTESDKQKLQEEFTQLYDEIDRIALTTEFNTKKILSGSYKDNGVVFQIGPNANQMISGTITNMTAAGLGLDETLKLGSGGIGFNSTYQTIQSVIESLDTAIDTVSAERSKLGAIQNRLEHTIANLSVTMENQRLRAGSARRYGTGDDGVHQEPDSHQSATAMQAQPI